MNLDNDYHYQLKYNNYNLEVREVRRNGLELRRHANVSEK